MARRKVKLNLDFKKIRKEVIKKSKKIPGIMRKMIIDEHIAKGVSPVNGQGKFKQYSPSYKKQIKSGTYNKFAKKIRPVNLKLSGELHKSFFVKVSDEGFRLGFDDRLADIHNRLGAGKSKTVRRMLPTRSGEVFNRKIINALAEELKNIISKVVRRRSRS